MENILDGKGEGPIGKVEEVFSDVGTDGVIGEELINLIELPLNSIVTASANFSFGPIFVCGHSYPLLHGPEVNIPNE